MERIGTVETKTRVRVFDEGNFRGYTEYLIESEPGARPAPQAFLVHQQPGWVLPVHFHLEEQFQVVTAGGGTLGRHALGAITVHYSTREAGYGPLTAGPEGLDYLTLRAVTDPGAWYLPESRPKMRTGLRRRHVTVGPLAMLGPSELAALPRLEVLEVITPDAEGLAGWLLRLPPGEHCTAPPQMRSGGRFHVVVGGALAEDTRVLARNACIWRGSEDAPMELRSGPDGAEVLVLQYPEAALEPEPQRT
ncbi:hypothetical protein [Xenophilus azovorans]|uniref:hypothetical protein n=1 Tax=Xenophilus azovorans TaxID=151755 RepID=UPI00068FD5B5|nr:hypothetical protein [Xenophilus azovorans]